MKGKCSKVVLTQVFTKWGVASYNGGVRQTDTNDPTDNISFPTDRWCFLRRILAYSTDLIRFYLRWRAFIDAGVPRHIQAPFEPLIYFRLC